MACACVENSSPSVPQPQYRRPCRGTDPAESGGLFPRQPAFLFPQLKPLPLWQHYPFYCTKERSLGMHSWSRRSQGPAVMWGFRSKAASQRMHALGSGPHRACPGDSEQQYPGPWPGLCDSPTCIRWPPWLQEPCGDGRKKLFLCQDVFLLTWDF